MSRRVSCLYYSTLASRPVRNAGSLLGLIGLIAINTHVTCPSCATRLDSDAALESVLRSSLYLRVAHPDNDLTLSSLLCPRIAHDWKFVLQRLGIKTYVSSGRRRRAFSVSLGLGAHLERNIVAWRVIPVMRLRRIFKNCNFVLTLPTRSSSLSIIREERPSITSITFSLRVHDDYEIAQLVDISQKILSLSGAPAISFNHAAKGYRLVVIRTNPRLDLGRPRDMQLSRQFGVEPIFGSELLSLYQQFDAVSQRPNVGSGYVTILQIFDGPPARVVVTVIPDYPSSVETLGGTEVTSWSAQALHPSRKRISNTAAAGRFVQDITGYVSNISADLLGSGGFADVRVGTVKSLIGQPLQAVFKVVRNHQIDRKTAFRRVEREVKIWLRLRHANILPILGTCSLEGELPVMVSPLCSRGDMTSYLKTCGKSGKELKVVQYSFAQQIACGLAYLHGNTPCVVHGDLKGDNILIADDGTVRICDFGLAAMNGERTASVESLKGTLAWMAPELLEEDDAVHTTESDIWAFACVVIEIFTGHPPYWPKRSPTQIILAISRGDIPQRPQGVSDELWTLLVTCFSFDPTLRPSAKQVFDEVECY